MTGLADHLWRGDLAVTGLGLVTPVGLSAAPSLAALRAGVSRLEALPGTSIAVGENEQEPIIGARVSVLTDGLLGQPRLKALMQPALEDCLIDCAASADQRIGIFLGTSGSSPANRHLQYDDAVKQNLLDCIPDTLNLTHARLIQTGRASVLGSIRDAAVALAEGIIDIALVGAADSWVTPRALNWLRQKGRLPEYPRHTGNLPAEAGGFVALETPQAAVQRGARTYAKVTASAGATESSAWGEANNGVALAHAIRGVAKGVADSHALVISDLDGERYRAMEWVMAQPKSMWYSETHEHWNPADCIGDSGASMGAIMLAWGSAALFKRYARTERVLVWGASDEGAREAIMLESAGVHN